MRLSEFWNALITCETPIEENHVIQLPANVFILGNPNLGSSIFIRPCYPELLATALAIIANTPHLVILGNPGIGKTYFGYVLLLYLARSGVTVVYESGKENARYLFSSNGIFTGTKDDFRSDLSETSTFYIVDASKPVDVAAKTILLSSPRREVWYKFSDDHCTIRYMPIWSHAEIECCRGSLFSHLTTVEVKLLYDKWGGIPRFILENARDNLQQVKLDNAITAVDLDLLFKAIGNPEASDTAAHRLIHINVAEDFCTIHYLFASEYVADQVYLQLYQKKREQLIQFLAVSQGVGDVGVLRGILFERHAHTVIQNGGSFQVRQLVNNGSDIACHNIRIPKCVLHLFDNDGEMTEQQVADRWVYERPKINNYESVDSFIRKGPFLFQMTGARYHPCKQTGLHKVLTLLNGPPGAKLFFVVPQDRFKSFTYQKYEGSDGKKLDQPSYANVKTLQQFVLAIDLTLSMISPDKPVAF